MASTGGAPDTHPFSAGSPSAKVAMAAGGGQSSILSAIDATIPFTFPHIRPRRDSRKPRQTVEGRLATTIPTIRPAVEAAIVLDLFYCLDWSYLEAERRRIRLPGLIDSNAIGQRRWALEWAVIMRGPYQSPPADWEEVDLST